MSRVYFHSQHGTAELRGSERAHLGSLVNDITTGMLRLEHTTGDWPDRLRNLLPANHYLREELQRERYKSHADWAYWYRLAFTIGFGDESLIHWKELPLSTFSFSLNTALAIGNDAIKLAARIHGQCEIHAYVEGINRAWLAGIIRDGLDSGIYRAGMWFHPSKGGMMPEGTPGATWHPQGWDDVITLLLSRDDEPVVMSYSVCDGFPNKAVGDWQPKQSYEEWYDLPVDKQWRISMAGLRASDKGLQIRPDDWQQFRFGHSLTVMDLQEVEWQSKLDCAVEMLSAAGKIGF